VQVRQIRLAASVRKTEVSLRPLFVRIELPAPCYYSQMSYFIATGFLLIIIFITAMIILRIDGTLFNLCMLMFHAHKRIFGLPPRPYWKEKGSEITRKGMSWIICKLSPEFRPKWLRFFLD